MAGSANVPATPASAAAAHPLRHGGLSQGGRDEVLHLSHRTRVRRIWPLDEGGSLIVKEALGPGSVERARHETRLLERLTGLDGLPRHVEGGHPGVVVVVDDRASPLTDSAVGRFRDGHALLTFMARLTDVVAGVHARGVIHRDVSASNVLVTDDGEPVLIDFELGSSIAEDRPSFGHHRELQGTLSYMPPEQTGRTARPVDQRADLYALGSLMYELATGAPPFDEDDELRLIHHILVTIPGPLSLRRPDLPPMLSLIAARLLEKEPDRRYQSAQGLAADLRRVIDDPEAEFRLGEHDFPPRLTAPSCLVGRDDQLAALRAAFDRTVGRWNGCLLLSGPAGVGKSALVAELKPAVAARGGWFVTGKAEQFRMDVSLGPVLQAVRGVARMLLAEPEAELARARGRLTEALGTNTDALTAALPEFAILLGTEASDGRARGHPTGDSAETQNRLGSAVADVLRTVVSPERPVVMFVDDLQWADMATLALLDVVVAGGGVPGLLVVGAFRDEDVGPAHPLSALRQRWARIGSPAPVHRLENLQDDDLGVLLSRILRLTPARAAELTEVVRECTGGNPFDTVELLNAFRRDGVLTLGPKGWIWDLRAARRHIGATDVVGLLQNRISALPAATRELLQVMACLGGEVGLDLLTTAVDGAAEDVRDRLLPALEDGLLVLTEAVPTTGTPQPGVLTFRHDRVLQATITGLSALQRSQRHLDLARQLADCLPFAAVAAEQYLAAGAEHNDATGDEERRQIVTLCRVAARSAGRTGSHACAERFLSAATHLWSSLGDPDATMTTALLTERHAALYGLGRLAEADLVWDDVLATCPDPVALAGPAGVQISSLSQRNRHREALTLGITLLGRLGITQPPPDRAAAGVSRGLDAVLTWSRTLDVAADLARPEVSDPHAHAVERLFSRLLPTSFFLGEPQVIAWIVIESQRLWAAHGPSAGLAATLSCTGLVAVPALADYRLGYTVGRHVLAVAEARGYEPETSVLRHRYSMHVLPWAEPLEDALDQARRAREGLLRGGDLQMANHTANTLLAASLDSGPSLEAHDCEVADVVALAERTGHRHTAVFAAAHRELVHTLKGRPDPDDSPDTRTSDGTAPLAEDPNPLATATSHTLQALAAAVFGDLEALGSHSETAMAMRRFVPGYPAAVIHCLRALAVSERLRRCEAHDQVVPLLAELDESAGWLAARAADLPGGFLHLARWIEAERAWAVGDTGAAMAAFDDACLLVTTRPRPWHRALICERTAAFLTTQGLQRSAQRALGEARRHYEDWGATAKVAALDAAHPWLRTTPVGAQGTSPRATRHGGATTGGSMASVDMLAVLRACQALSSQTQLADLQAALVSQLTALTGATDVVVAIRDPDDAGWYVPVGERSRALSEAAAAGSLPLSAFRYAERTREPLLVDDATRDDRFAADPYMSGLTRCSLLVVPVLTSGQLSTVLILTNRRDVGAFTTDRLDAVALITGQLAVSLGNARLYAQLEARVADRTQALESANHQLETLSLTDSLTGIGNRRRFEQAAAEYWHRSLLAQEWLSLIMIDVDHFKRYNDHYGHLAGDECLRKVAAALADACSSTTDLACRYGGEEFVLLTHGGSPDGGREFAERVRAAVEALDIGHIAGGAGRVTVSIGVATVMPSAADDVGAVLARADSHLYLAKQGGRNQVCGSAGVASSNPLSSGRSRTPAD